MGFPRSVAELGWEITQGSPSLPSLWATKASVIKREKKFHKTSNVSVKNEQKEKKNRTSCTSSAASHPKSMAHDLRKAQEPQQEAEMLQGAGSLLGHPRDPTKAKGRRFGEYSPYFAAQKMQSRQGEDSVSL